MVFRGSCKNCKIVDFLFCGLRLWVQRINHELRTSDSSSRATQTPKCSPCCGHIQTLGLRCTQKILSTNSIFGYDLSPTYPRVVNLYVKKERNLVVVAKVDQNFQVVVRLKMSLRSRGKANQNSHHIFYRSENIRKFPGRKTSKPLKHRKNLPFCPQLKTSQSLGFIFLSGTLAATTVSSPMRCPEKTEQNF